MLCHGPQPRSAKSTSKLVLSCPSRREFLISLRGARMGHLPRNGHFWALSLVLRDNPRSRSKDWTKLTFIADLPLETSVKHIDDSLLTRLDVECIAKQAMGRWQGARRLKSRHSESSAIARSPRNNQHVGADNLRMFPEIHKQSGHVGSQRL